MTPPTSRAKPRERAARSWLSRSRAGSIATSTDKVGDQREGVEVAALVGVVLDADQVEPSPLGRQHLLDDVVVALGVRRDRDAELERRSQRTTSNARLLAGPKRKIAKSSSNA